MIQPRILVLGEFYSNDIDIKFDQNSTRATDSKLENEIELFWEKALILAKEKNKKIWNDEHYRLNSYLYANNHISLNLSTIDYKTTQALKYHPDLDKMPESYYSQCMLGVGIIKTSDNKYLFGKVGQAFVMDKYMLIGGGYSKVEHKINDGEDIFSQIYYELEEEANIKKEFVEHCHLSSLILTEMSSIVFAFEIKLSIDSKTCIELFSTKNDLDLSELLTLDAKEALEMLESIGGYKKLLKYLVI